MNHDNELMHERRRPSSAGWRQWRRIGGRLLLLAALLVTLILPRGDRYVLTPVQELAVDSRFSLVAWEFRNALSKWWSRSASLFRGVSGHEGATLVDRYLAINRDLDALQGQLARAAAVRGTDLASDDHITELEGRIARLQAERRSIRPRLEEYLESELSTTLASQGLGRFGPMLWPPVDFRMEEPPQLLIVSRRDRIERLEDVLLDADTKTTRAEAIEALIKERENKSAVVERLGGLATYPNIVPPDYDTLPLLQVAAHEWIHSYLFFRPLGQRFNDSGEMAILNETLASLAGDELGGQTWSRLTGQPAPLPALLRERDHPVPGGEFNFDAFMRATRQRTDELLLDGQIEAAESYMDQRRIELQDHGYFLRKLNQAYFAFHGTYADSPSSTSPIGPQVAEFRKLSSDIGETVREIGAAGSYEEFLRILEAKRSAARTPASR